MIYLAKTSNENGRRILAVYGSAKEVVQTPVNALGTSFQRLQSALLRLGLRVGTNACT